MKCEPAQIADPNLNATSLTSDDTGIDWNNTSSSSIDYSEDVDVAANASSISGRAEYQTVARVSNTGP